MLWVYVAWTPYRHETCCQDDAGRMRRRVTMTIAMVWSYFSNCAGAREAAFATRPIEYPIFHDVGATLPT